MTQDQLIALLIGLTVGLTFIGVIYGLKKGAFVRAPVREVEIPTNDVNQRFRHGAVPKTTTPTYDSLDDDPRYVLVKCTLEGLQKLAVNDNWGSLKFTQEVLHLLKTALEVHDSANEYEEYSEYAFGIIALGFGAIRDHVEAPRNLGSRQILLKELDDFLVSSLSIHVVQHTVAQGRDRRVHFNERSDAMVKIILEYFTTDFHTLAIEQPFFTTRQLRQDFMKKAINHSYADAFHKMATYAANRETREKADSIRRGRTRRGRRKTTK
jgi:hypothetical protein